MTFAIMVVFTAHALAAAQTYTALRSADESGKAVGLHIFGIPLEAVIAATMLPLGYWVFTDARRDVSLAIGLGAACAYAVTWGRAVAFVAAGRRARDDADPASADE